MVPTPRLAKKYELAEVEVASRFVAVMVPTLFRGFPAPSTADDHVALPMHAPLTLKQPALIVRPPASVEVAVPTEEIWSVKVAPVIEAVEIVASRREIVFNSLIRCERLTTR